MHKITCTGKRYRRDGVALLISASRKLSMGILEEEYINFIPGNLFFPIGTKSLPDAI
jgi:hypothetical protein